MIKKLPISTLALVLSFGTLGKIGAGMYNNVLYYAFFVIATLFLLGITARVIIDTENTILESKSPIVFPLLLLLPMALAVLNSYLASVFVFGATFVWYICLSLVLLFNIFYIKRIFTNKDYKMILPNMFVNLVGVDVLVLNAPQTISMELLKLIFYVSLITYIISLVSVTYCAYKYKNFNKKTMPLYAIYLAPPSLILATGIKSTIMTNEAFCYIFLALIVIMLIIYIISFVKTVPNFKNFVPTYGAFTFPIVISCLAFKLANKTLGLNLLWLVNIYYFIAIVVVLFISYLYLKYIFEK